MKSKNLSSVDSTESSQSISRQWTSKVSITREQLIYDFNVLKLNQTQAAIKYGCTTESIRRARARWNIVWEPFTEFYISEVDLRKYLLQDGLSQAEIAVKLGCSTTVIKKYIRIYDIITDSRITYVSSKKVRRLIVDKAIFTDEQKHIIVGSILGDGNIAKESDTGNAFLQIAQRIDRIEYLAWLVDQLQPFSKTIHHHVANVHAFSTVCFSEFNYYYDLFWCNGRKTVPVNIANLLSESVLARWFEQDGHTDKSNSVLSTCGFTEEECNLLCKALFDVFNIQSVVKVQTKTGTNRCWPTLNFRVVAHKQLHEIVDPLLHTCFEYKKLRK